MSMISEQVANLREKAQIFEDSGCATNGIVKTFREAADTIEELSAKLANVNMERSTAHYNDGWIPVAERLPELCKEVLVEVRVGDEIWHDISERFKDYNDKISWSALCGMEPIAWMPMPEPYKGGGVDGETDSK